MKELLKRYLISYHKSEHINILTYGIVGTICTITYVIKEIPQETKTHYLTIWDFVVFLTNNK